MLDFLDQLVAMAYLEDLVYLGQRGLWENQVKMERKALEEDQAKKDLKEIRDLTDLQEPQVHPIIF